MKIFLLKRTDGWNYDDYDSCVVCAENEDDAKTIHPNGGLFVAGKKYDDWVSQKSDILCTKIGEANKSQKRGVILASYNAG